VRVEIELRPRGKKATWVLVIQGDRARLFDEDDELLEEWRGAEVLKGFLMPSFWENRRYFGLKLDGKQVDFEADKEALAELWSFHDWIYVEQYPDAPKRKLLLSLGKMLGGLVIGGVAGYLNWQAFQDDDGPRRLWYGGLVLGTIMFFYGFFKLFEIPYWTRMARQVNAERGEQDEDEERRPKRKRRDDDED
jgi:hypothetical protein